MQERKKYLKPACFFQAFVTGLKSLYSPPPVLPYIICSTANVFEIKMQGEEESVVLDFYKQKGLKSEVKQLK